MRIRLHHQGRLTRDQRQGAMAVLFALCLPLVLMFSAFAINVAWMQLTRTELRTATDSAARAASRTLSLTQDPDTARDAAIDGAARNQVAGTPLVLRDEEVVFGNSQLDTDTGRFQFAAQPDSSNTLNAVRVLGNRTEGSGSGAIPMLFQGMFDRSTFEPVKSATASHLDRDVFLVLDRSGSMGTVTRGGNRWSDLQAAVRQFLDTLEATPQNENVGLATYSTRSTLDVNLTSDYSVVQNQVNRTRVGGWTAIGLGMRNAITGLENPSFRRRMAARTIVVMTDGHHNRSVDPEVVAAEAQALNITVHTITFSSGAEQNRMRDVAAAGGGKHWHANNEAQLIRVFEEVAWNLPTLLTE